MFNVGSVQGYLKLNTTGWNSSMGAAGASLSSLSRSFARFGAVTVGSLVLITREFGKFDKAIRHATSVSETTEEQFRKMSEMALDASVQWNKAATSTAQAFYYLGSAGLTVTEQMQAFNDTIMLSRAMGSELGQTVEGVVDIVRAFGLEFANISEIADQLTKTVISSNQQFRTLDQALSYAASTAALTNNTLAETTAMLGVMANAGIKGSMAGTVLRRAMTNLMSPTGDMAALINDLGISIYGATGRMKPFIQIMGEISDRLTTASDEYKNMVFEVLFGRRAIAGQIVLFNKGSVALRQYADEIKNSGGTTERVAKKQMKAMSEILGQLWRQMQRMAIMAGQTLAPALERISEHVRYNVKDFEKYVKANREIIAETLKMATILGTMLVIGVPLLALTVNLITNTMRLAAVIANPWIALVAALYVIRAVWKQTSEELISRARMTAEAVAYKQIGPGGIALGGMGAGAIAGLPFGPGGAIVGGLGGLGLGVWEAFRAKESLRQFTMQGKEAALDLNKVWEESLSAVRKQMKSDFGAGFDFLDSKLLSADSIAGDLWANIRNGIKSIKDLLNIFSTEPTKGGLGMPALALDERFGEMGKQIKELEQQIADAYDPQEPGSWQRRWDLAVKDVMMNSGKLHAGFTTAMNGIKSDWTSTIEVFMNGGGKMKNFLDQMFSDILTNFNHLVAQIASENLLYAIIGKRGAGTPEGASWWVKLREMLFGPGVDVGLGSMIYQRKPRASFLDMFQPNPPELTPVINPLSVGGQPSGLSYKPAFKVEVTNATGVEAAAKSAGEPTWNGEEWVVGVVLNRYDTDPNFRNRLGG